MTAPLSDLYTDYLALPQYAELGHLHSRVRPDLRVHKGRGDCATLPGGPAFCDQWWRERRKGSGRAMLRGLSELALGLGVETIIFWQVRPKPEHVMFFNGMKMTPLTMKANHASAYLWRRRPPAFSSGPILSPGLM